MIVERTDTEIIFRLPTSTDTKGLQEIYNYLKFKELVKGSTATENEANLLAAESKKNWWTENKNRFIK